PAVVCLIILILDLLLFLHAAAPPAIFAFSLHDALPISLLGNGVVPHEVGLGLGNIAADGDVHVAQHVHVVAEGAQVGHAVGDELDRKSTRLNSSHVKISYAVFCLKKKNIYSRMSCNM